MRSGGKFFADDFGEDSCAGPDTGAGYRRENHVTWAGLHEGFDLDSDLVALPAQGQELLSQFRLHDPDSTGALGRRMFLQPCSDAPVVGGLQRPRRG